MYLYLVDRTDTVDYDEVDSLVAAANTPKQARTIAKTARGAQSESVWDSAKVTNLGTARKGTKPSIVLDSFIAG